MPSVRRVLLAAATVAAALILWVPAASATVTVSENTGTLQIISTDGGYNNVSVSFESGRIRIGNSYHVELDASATDCESQPFDLAVICDDVFSDLQAQFGGGADTFTLAICLPTALIDLGDGYNEYDGPTCAEAKTVTVYAGADHDTLYGSRDGASHTVDQLVGGGAQDTIDGGAGDDVLYGGDGDDAMTEDYGGNDQVYGEAGDDTLRGGTGNDVEDGGVGDDKIGWGYINSDDDQGADAVSGGVGTDELWLDRHTGAMTINLDGQANDGSPGEGDNIAPDFEVFVGTSGNDVFFGSPGPEQFSGNDGNDELHGGDGSDTLRGNYGNDTVNGDGGPDQVEGSDGSDTVDGGAGADKIYGDTAGCSDDCEDDPDMLFARDGEKDTVNCGGGPDSAQVDSLDLVAACVSIDRSTDTTTGKDDDNIDNTPVAGFDLKIAGSIKLKTLLKKGLAVKLTCTGACRLGAKLNYKSKKLGAGSKALPGTGSAKLTLKLVKKGRATVRKLGHGKLTVHATVGDAAGKATPITRTVKLKR
jgi:Ca2+-binding RTX toxin-like protein